MKLWVLRPVDEGVGPWVPWYDKAMGFLVRAEDERDARLFAAANCGDEGKDAWLLDVWSTCVEVVDGGRPGLVMRDFWRA